MASLRELLTEEGFYHRNSAKYQNSLRHKHKQQQDDKKPLPVFICHDPRGFDSSKHRDDKATTRSGSSSSQSKRVGSTSERSNSTSFVSGCSRTAGPFLDDVAIRAVVGILSGYIGRYMKDDYFQKTLREKCYSCLVRRRRKDSDDEILANMKLGMDNIDKLVEDQGAKREMRIKILRNSIELLTIIASLNSKTSRDGSTCGIPNSHLSACAQLYLAIVYKLEKNDRISARHLLQVFCDSTHLARTFLLPDLWEHLFLPHLLHLKIWYNKELELISDADNGDKEKKIKALSKVYNERMDMGTSLFALYYKQWLKVGANEPPLPIVPLPSRQIYRSSRRKSSESFSSHSSINPNLYQAVFGPRLELQSTSHDDRSGMLTISWISEKGEILYEGEDNCSSVQKEDMTYLRRSSRKINKNHAELGTQSKSQKTDSFQCLSCMSIPAESFVNGNHAARKTSAIMETTLLSSDLIGAITSLCSSNILSKCEFSIRVITKAWLNSHGDPLIEEALIKPSVIEGMLEVLFASNEAEILELVISILAELIGRNEVTRQIILNSDPHLEIFVRHLRSTSLFLKAAVLLYLSKPQAKQMISAEWVPLVLRVLEFGGNLQTLFTVQCNPQVAAFYFLDQLLTGFDEDRNIENARQVVSLGGLPLLLRGIEEGQIIERNSAASIILCCIRAEGSCRNFLADNLNKASLMELIVLGNTKHCNWCAFSVLAELICLERRTKISSFLNGLKEGWGGLNTMHILFVYLQRALPEERPLVATILLLLDLMEDPSRGSLYREEAVEAIVAALNCQSCDDIIQEQSARALLVLGGRFSFTGESTMERWLLQQAGYHGNSIDDSVHGKEIVVHDFHHNIAEEEAEAEIWQERVACVLFKSGNTPLLSALRDSIANGIPSLARASLITISWMSSYLHLIKDAKLQRMTLSILLPQILESLNYDSDVEERVLASYSLLCLIKGSGSVFILLSLEKESLRHLRNLSLVTWTANELISIISKNSLESKC
ncbi:hypothetical protein L6164_036907 [Bauhinia variegata]|uniref:Uncharacterized protein n=1 Tax=Bauhinia variegata TaxID=167791 RepID=A0ACB9KIJ3_BAUVA|nr:hypothetical protein L6164_036907 [Bauhinia variegata]